jgi:predicted MarR family transcription regulator
VSFVNREQIMAMDSNILLSLINMKLRDEFESLEDLCVEYDVDDTVIINKLKIIGYKYNHNTNQFVSLEV